MDLSRSVDLRKCLRCGHTWTSQLERPQACPRCKSYIWDKPRDREQPESALEELREEEVKP